MTRNGRSQGEAERAVRVVVFAPTANDARLTVEFLEESGFDAEVCKDFGDLNSSTNESCGCLIVAEEGLHDDSSRLLVAALEHQPSWSDIPVIIITSGGRVSRERLQRLALLGPGGNVSLLERPFRPDTLVSTIAVALKARTRQFQVRDLLQDLSAARDDAEQANRAKDDFLAALSHELRTPLNPVLLLASAGAANPTLPEKVRKDFSVIRKNVNLEARLIDDLLDLTRIARGKLHLDRIRCDIHEILRDAVANVQVDAAEKKASLIHAFHAKDSSVIGDPVRLQQVFWNVLKNAVKFAPDGSAVRIETSNAANGQVTIRIIDAGIGLAPAELEHIFDAFSQGSHASPHLTARYGGLGLGLSISRMLVEHHEGTISAASDGEGLGATFTIALPSAEAAESLPARAPSHAPENPSHPATRSARYRVLLVEDHEDTLTALSFLLRKKYDVVTAISGSEARARAEENTFDIVVSDIGLPDERGSDLMAFLKDRHGLSGIALTGYGMDDDVRRSKQAGFVAHLTKPVEFPILEKALADALA